MTLRIKGYEARRPQHSGLPLLRFLVSVVFSVALVWLISSEEQRQRYRLLLGMADAPVVAGQEPAPAPAPAPSLALPVPVRPAGPVQPARLTPADAATHQASGAGSPCAAGVPANPTHAVAGQVYRWTDADGRPHFSDRPPAGADAEVLGATAGGGVGMFSVDYRFLGREPPVELKLALATNIDGVFRTISQDLGLRHAAPIHVNLTIVEGSERFTEHRERHAKGLATTSGFYSFRGNEAAVRWVGTAATLAVARHEISHLALGNWVGLTPLWFNEGLAEVMERLVFVQSYARAEADEDQILELRRLLDEGRLPALRGFLQAGQEDWDRTGHAITYPYAWSLVLFLLQDAAGRTLVSDYLNQLVARRCQSFDHLAFFERGYAGGIDRFEADWRRWLAEDAPKAIQF